jgi:phage terminase large subunit GpA-like protein
MQEQLQLKALARSWVRAERLDIVDWCERYMVLPPSYAIPGPFSIKSSRYMIAPLRAIADPDVREVTTCKGIQTGGSLVTEAAILWAISNAPAPMMWTQQSDEDAKEHCRGRFNSLMRHCKPVRDLLPTGNRHDMTTTEVWFGDFFLLVNGANKNNLQSKSIRWKFNSECWLWEQGLMKQAKGRVSAYERAGTSKVVNESQGCVSGHDFEREWLSGSQEEWAVPCAGCGKLHKLDFFGRMAGDEKKRACVVWDPEAVGERGRFDEQRVRDSVRWVCPSCGHEHEDSARTRARWNDGGGYLAGIPGSIKRRSFRWNSLTGHSLGDMAVEFLNASIFKQSGMIAPMRDFYMQRLAEFWKTEEEVQVEKTELKLGAYRLRDIADNPAEKMAGEVLRIATIDRQRDHFWMVMRAWAADGESWLIWRGKVLTIEACIELADRYGLERRHIFEDAQHDPGAVYTECVKYGINALHGSGEDGFTWEIGGKKVRRFYSPVKRAQVPGGFASYMLWASDPIKDKLHHLKTGNGEKWNLPSDVDDGLDARLTYTRQLSGDQKRERVNKKNGRKELRWTRVWDNHFWDCEAMQVVVVMALKILAAPEPEEKK